MLRSSTPHFHSLQKYVFERKEGRGFFCVSLFVNPSFSSFSLLEHLLESIILREVCKSDHLKVVIISNSFIFFKKGLHMSDTKHYNYFVIGGGSGK